MYQFIDRVQLSYGKLLFLQETIKPIACPVHCCYMHNYKIKIGICMIFFTLTMRGLSQALFEVDTSEGLYCCRTVQARLHRTSEAASKTHKILKHRLRIQTRFKGKTTRDIFQENHPPSYQDRNSLFIQNSILINKRQRHLLRVSGLLPLNFSATNLRKRTS